MGASIGVPLYLTRPLGIAMYIFGFREGWLWAFPSHDPVLVDLLVFVRCSASRGSARRRRFGCSTWSWPSSGFRENGFVGTDFWRVFAVLFPATTGVLSGTNMSGELRDPRRAIPIGTLSAIAVSSVIYFGLSLWAVQVATPQQLVGDYELVLDKARWGWLVLVGLLGATASAALAGLVGGPRILMAIGNDRLLPARDWTGKTSADGEPRNAMLLTGALVLAALTLRDLNVIAPLVTMFFLITYGVLNFVVLPEGSLGLVSFRPTLRVPRIVPLFGLLGSMLAMLIVSPVFGLVALMLVGVLYLWIQRRDAPRDEAKVSSAIFAALAGWAAQRAQANGESESARAWKPSFLVPVEDPEELRGEYTFLVDVARAEGSVKLLGLTRIHDDKDVEVLVAPLGRSFREDGVYCTWSVVDEERFGEGVIGALKALQSAFFRPNMLFLTLPSLQDRHDEFVALIQQAAATRVGVTLLGLHPKAGLARRRRINLWLRWQGADWDVDTAFSVGSLNLTLLMGYRLQRQWGADLQVTTVVPSQSDVAAAEAYLAEVVDLARLPRVERVVRVGGFEECVAGARAADLAIMGLQRRPDFVFVTRMLELSRSSCLMVLDSGRESARA